MILTLLISYIYTWKPQIVDNDGDCGKWCSIACDSAGNLYVSYYNATKDSLFYARFDGNNWEKTGITKGGIFSSLAIDQNKNPHIVFYSSDRRYLLHTYFDTVWHFDTIDTVLGGYCDIACRFGKIFVVYYDSINGDLKGAIIGDSISIGIFDTTGDVGKWASVSIPSDTSLAFAVISYYRKDKGDFLGCYKTAGTWFKLQIDTMGDVGKYSDCVVSSNADYIYAFFSYFDETNSKLKLFACSAYVKIDTIFLGFVDTSLSSGYYTSVTSYKLSPFVSYHQKNKGILKVAYFYNRKWFIKPADTIGICGLYSSCVSDGKYVHIVYYDSLSKSLKYLKCKPDSVNSVKKIIPDTIRVISETLKVFKIIFAFPLSFTSVQKVEDSISLKGTKSGEHSLIEISVNGETLKIVKDDSSFIEGETLTLYIPKSIKDIHGMEILREYYLRFKVKSYPPYLLFTEPFDGEGKVSYDCQRVKAVFSEKMDSLSIIKSLNLRHTFIKGEVSGNHQYDSIKIALETLYIYLNPKKKFYEKEKVYFVIGADVRDFHGIEKGVVDSVCFYIEGFPPSPPLNVCANGTNPSPWTSNGMFVITWENPPRDTSYQSPVKYAFYKISKRPAFDYDTTGKFISSPSTLYCALQGIDTVFVWLVDTMECLSCDSLSLVILRGDTLPPLYPESIYVNGLAKVKGWFNFDTLWIRYKENPVQTKSDISGIRRAFYKIGEPPSHPYDTTGSSKENPFLVKMPEGESEFFLWLQDNSGNVNHINNKNVKIRVDLTSPEIIDVIAKNVRKDTFEVRVRARDRLSGINLIKIYNTQGEIINSLQVVDTLIDTSLRFYAQDTTYIVSVIDSAGNESEKEKVTIIPEFLTRREVYAYPNPAKDYVYFHFLLNKDAKVVVAVYNLRGYLVRKIVKEVPGGRPSHLLPQEQRIKLSTYGLPPGVYYYRFTAIPENGGRKVSVKGKFAIVK